jgi:hypothetical protein
VPSCVCIVGRWAVRTRINITVGFYKAKYGGQSKSSQNGGMHFNGRTYGNAYLITFKVRHLRARTHTHTHTHTTHTFASSILPLLEAPAEGFFWNLSEFSCRIRFDVLCGRETCPVETHFQSREQSKVIRNEIRRVRRLDDDRNCCQTREVWLGALVNVLNLGAIWRWASRPGRFFFR